MFIFSLDSPFKGKTTPSNITNQHVSGAEPSEKAALAYKDVGTYNLVAVSGKSGTRESSVLTGGGYRLREAQNMHFVEYVLQDLSSRFDLPLRDVNVSKVSRRTRPSLVEKR